jgi:hypothetical protein
VSQAQGGKIAYCGVGVWHENDGSSDHTSSVSWNTLLGFCDAGGIWPGEAYATTSIVLSVDIHEPGPSEREYTKTTKVVNGARMWNIGVYDAHSYSDSGSLSLSWSGDAGAIFSVWATVVLEVWTWGPWGAQANLHVIFTDIDPG